MNTYVNFEIAKLLKEKGFKLPCFYYYDKNGKLNEPYLENGSSTDVEFRVDLTDLIEYYNSYSTQYISAPTIAEVVMWLYDKHGVWIGVTKYKDHEDDVNDPYYFTPDNGRHIYKTPTEAYEARIKFTLEHLIWQT